MKVPSSLRCNVCGDTWDTLRLPCCSTCLARRWRATPNLIREKHHPHSPSTRHERYRSIVTPRLLQDLDAVLGFAARRGTWFYDTGYGMLVHVTPAPLGRMPGVGIPAHRTEPDHALDCLFIAEADSASRAHAFAVDGQRHRAQIKAGVFLPLGACSFESCQSHPVPGRAHCGVHGEAHLATEDPRAVQSVRNRSAVTGSSPSESPQ